jgi:ACS family D-galactonate transporter-like MFS transporter
VPATSVLVDKGPRVQQIVAAHPEQVKVLQTVDAGTLAALARNPADTAAQARAISRLTGQSPAQVARVSALGARYKQELATAAAIDPATLLALSRNSTDRRAAGRAVAEVAGKSEIPPRQAAARLQALGAVAPADIAFLQANGSKVEQAAARLQSVSQIPPADLAFLQANAAKVEQAQKDNPGQWQTWWWICFLGQLAFIPFVFLMAGRWSPRKARRDELEHERQVQRDLARLMADTTREAPAAPAVIRS